MRQHSKHLDALIQEIRTVNPIPRKVRGKGRRMAISRRHPDHPSHRQDAQRLLQARLRLGIAMLASRGYDPPEIARILGISLKMVEARMEDSLKALHAFDEEQERLRAGERYDEDLPHAAGTRPKKAGVIPLVSGDVLPNPDIYQLQKDAFELRTKAYPYHEIAAVLGCSEQEARNAVKTRLHFLEQDELTETSLARRLHLEQIDMLLRGVMADALGENDLDRPTVYKAMDRAVALMDMRAKLLGLNAPQKIDLEERLVVISKEYKYDIDELKEIAAEVVAARTAGSLR
jgi:hypothetical protein